MNKSKKKERTGKIGSAPISFYLKALNHTKIIISQSIQKIYISTSK